MWSAFVAPHDACIWHRWRSLGAPQTARTGVETTDTPARLSIHELISPVNNADVALYAGERMGIALRAREITLLDSLFIRVDFFLIKTR